MSIYRGKNKKDIYLAAKLYDAIEDRDFSSVKSLLCERGGDPNLVLPKKGIAPFHLVIGNDDYDFTLKVVTLLLQNGGNPNVRSDDGLTPLHIAAAWGRVELVGLLLRCGGDPDARDANRKSPLHYALEERHPECLALLRQYHPANQSMDDLLVEVNRGRRRESEDCDLVLEKVIIDTGTIIGEYEIVEEQKPDSIKVKKSQLDMLPQSDTTEYVLNWFNKHIQPTIEEPLDNLTKSTSGSTATESPVDSFESSVDESDGEPPKLNMENITFRKVYRKTRKHTCTPPKTSSVSPSHSDKNNDRTLYLDATNKYEDATKYLDIEDFTELKEYSTESGIVTLPDSESKTEMLSTISKNVNTNQPTQLADEPKKQETSNDKSSDYLTCSLNSLEKNAFEITEDITSISNNMTSEESSKSILNIGQLNIKQEEISVSDQSFVSVSEVYKYVDKQEGIVLYERRLLKTPSECGGSVKSSSFSSKLSSLPESVEYDTDTIRKELTWYGYNPGPITATTKRVYIRKLHQIKKYPAILKKEIQLQNKRTYSVELERTLRDPNWYRDVAVYKNLEDVLSREFATPDPSRKWREGVNKSSFTYLLLDPRITNNLPCRADMMQPKEVWETFLSAIFYVGKGKRARPYQHLYEAVDMWKNNQLTSSNKKLQNILDIWKTNSGVICLHVFQNIIPVEAYTREASMISALKLDNITNIRPGDFYGLPATWPQKQKKMLGVYLLYKAMVIFLNEGERQLCPADIE